MERKYIDRLLYGFKIPRKIQNLMSTIPKQLGPEWFIKKTLWESRSISS